MYVGGGYGKGGGGGGGGICPGAYLIFSQIVA